MAVKLTNYAKATSLHGRLTVRLSEPCLDTPADSDKLGLLLSADNGDRVNVASRYGCVLTDSLLIYQRSVAADVPVVLVESITGYKEGHIVTIDAASGFIRVIYRPESSHNTLFTTDRCNSNCIMCSQPPKEIDDGYLVAENLRMLSLIQKAPESLGITGGEPTLLGDDLIRLLETTKELLPQTHIHMLTNGRRYKDAHFVRRLAQIRHPSLTSAIPLYADLAGIHDYIVQAQRAFDETIEGIYNAAEVGLAVEIRIVLHKQSIPRLRQLTEFIYHNIPFAVHVAFMGLENMGYVKKNWEELWIDPVEYMDSLNDAVKYLYLRRMNVSIYNLQLCLLHRSLWSFARKSISDFKNEYLDICNQCSVTAHCCGLFLSQVNRHSVHIKPLPLL